jgi:peptidoglycan/xylan/chitin deacetylase (PgdA/CDA1 family)
MKNANWKNNAQCAVMITVNLDAEMFWLSLSPDVINRPKTMSMGQYGMKRGLNRVLETLDEFGIAATFFVPGRVAEIYPDKIRDVASRGHEIANHGYMHENFAMISEQEQKTSMEKGFAAIKNICGLSAIGFRAPEGELTIETCAWQKLVELFIQATCATTIDRI